MHVRKLNEWLSNTSQTILIFRCQDLSLILKTHVRLLFVLIFTCVWKQRNITIRVYLHSEKNDQFSVSSIPVMMFIESMMFIKSMMFVVFVMMMMMVLYHRHIFFFCVMDWFMHLHWMVNIDMHWSWNMNWHFHYGFCKG